MPGLRGSRRTATESVYAALSQFEAESGLAPLVVLLPSRLFSAYSAEAARLNAVLPAAREPRGPEWCDVRVVEHEQIDEIEVY